MTQETIVATPTLTPRRVRRLSWFGLLATTLVAGCASSVAAPEPYPTEVVDPPARVGSISALRGSVDASSEPGGAWEPAKLNWPVTTGSALWSPPGSQAEVRIGSASVRIDGNTQAVFQKLDDDEVAIDVAQGSVRARVRRLDPDDRFVVAADGVRAEAQGPGDYRVSYDPDRRAYTVRVISGRMRIATPGNSFNLEAGQESIVEGGGATLALRPMGPRDDFDAWAEARDREQDRLAATRYVSPETTGIESLDAHGRWEIVGDYGPVWYPRAVPYGWAPYRYGHWAWVRPWGWTWVDDAPWGFAPFHYGRWSQFGGVWGWVPGPIVHRPVWAPALVGYVGAGGVSLSIGIGSSRPVGWFPLGPREVYYPGYRYSPRYAQRFHHEVHPVAPPPRGERWADRRPVPGAPAYRYANRPEAVTLVREEQFRGARPIGRDRLDLTPQQAAGLHPVLLPPGLPPGGRSAAPGVIGGNDARPSPRGDIGRGVASWPNGNAMPGSRPDREDRGPRGLPPGMNPANPAPPFERGPSTGRDLIPGQVGTRPAPPQPGAVGPAVPMPAPRVHSLPSSPPPVAQPAAPQPEPRGYGSRGDPRFADERNFDRGPFGRGMPQPARPAPDAPRGAMPAPQPVPQAAPRPATAPPAAPRVGREGREEGDGAKFWRGVGPKER